MKEIKFSIARDFSRTPGPRFKKEGQHSGEALLDEHLRARFCQARDEKVPLEVDLDGTAGYATSFLEAVFGGLAREFGSDTVKAIIRIRSEEEPHLKKEIDGYIEDAQGGDVS